MDDRRAGRGPTRSRRIRAGSWIFAALALCACAFAQDESLVQWHDVRALEAAGMEDPVGVDLRLHLSSAFLDNLEPDRYGVPLEPFLSARSLGWSELLWDCLGEAWPDDSFFIDQRGGFLRIEAGPATQRELERILVELEEHFLRAVELEVFVLPAAAVGPETGAVLSPAEADALVAAAAPLDYARTSARAGRRARLGEAGFEAALVDYDVEVAKSARVGDPAVTVLREGTEIGAIARACAGGGIYLRAWGRRGVRGERSRRIALESFGGAEIELPTMSTTLAAGSALLPDGGGLLLAQDRNADGVWLIRVRREDRRPGQTETRSPFVPLGSLTAQPLMVPPPWTPRADPSGGWEELEPLLGQLSEGARAPAFSPEELLEELRAEQERQELGGSLVLAGDAVYVRGSEALREQTEELVRTWSEALTGATVEIEVRLGLLERSAFEELRAGGGLDPRALAGRLEHRLLGACRAGDSLLVVGGAESFYLQDHDVEIAEGAAIGDPIYDALFEGISFWCLPSPTRSGRISAWIDLELQAPARETVSMPVALWEPREKDDDKPGPAGAIEVSGTVQLPATARASLRTMLQLAQGEWTLLGCTGLAGTDRTLVAVAKASSVPAR